MTTKPRPKGDPFGFQVARADLGPLVSDLMKVAVDDNSPLAEIVRAYRAGKKSSPGEEVKAIATNASVKQAIQILAQPALVMSNRTGGGGSAAGLFTACHAPAVDPQAIVVILPSYEGSVFIQIFAEPEAFVAWWLAGNASPANRDVVNPIPSPVSYEALVYLFHAIDLFRRGAMQSQLEFSPSSPAPISVDTFGSTLNAAVANTDFRWLVTAFLGLTPGLDSRDFDTGAAHFDALQQLDFLHATEAEDSQLLFGEIGQATGLEFHRSWFQAIGFETRIRVDGKWQRHHSGFLAPTGQTNHLVMIDPGGDELPLVHQSLTRNDLIVKFTDLFGQALGGCDTAPVKPPEATPATRNAFCGGCGAKLAENTKFCTQCGRSR